LCILLVCWYSLIEFRISCCLSTLITQPLIHGLLLLAIIFTANTHSPRRIRVIPSQRHIDLISDDDFAILMIVFPEISELALDDPVLVDDVLVAVLEVDEAAQDPPLLVPHLRHLHLQALQGHYVLDLKTQLVQVKLNVGVRLVRVVEFICIMLITICSWIINPSWSLI
jgi:hypothetical protein